YSVAEPPPNDRAPITAHIRKSRHGEIAPHTNGSLLRLGESPTASSLHASDRCARRARVSLRPTAAIHERQEIADDAIEVAGRLEVDGMAAVRHDGESGGGDVMLHQHTRQQTGPILVTG